MNRIERIEISQVDVARVDGITPWLKVEHQVGAKAFVD
jgi:hypothetical protein